MYQIEQVPISKLKNSEYNPRGATTEEIKDLKNSIQEFGFIDPVIVNSAKNRKNIIIGGHFRIHIAKEIGFKQAPVIFVKIPNIKKEQELNLRLNKNLGHWDYDLLANFDEEQLTNVGFSKEEIDQVFQIDKDIRKDEIPELPKKTKIKIGDLYILGKHRLLCGDSIKREDVERLMDGKAGKMIFTSPPYNMNSGKKLYTHYRDNLESEEYISFNLNALNNFKRFLKGFVFWNISYNKNARWEFIEIIYRIVKETGLKFLELIIWDKGHALPITSKEGLTRQYEDILLTANPESIEKDLELFYCGRNDKRAWFNKKTQRGITNYWRIGTNKSQLNNHHACYPVGLPIKAIMLMSDREDRIIDPFIGSGSTMIACEMTNRKCYGMEINPIYCDVTIQRWENFTGQKAKRLNN